MFWFLLMLVTGFFTLRGIIIFIRTAASTDNIGGAMLLAVVVAALGFVTYLLGTAAFAS